MSRIRLLLISSIAILLSGCPGKGEPVTPSESHDDYDVEKLFIVDGCTVYRFHDNGYRHYFTTCDGATQHKHTVYQSTGKSSTSYMVGENIPTVVRP